MNYVNEARDRPTKMARVRVLQRWINQAGKYECAIKNLLPEEMNNDEEEALLETWDMFREALDEAVALVDGGIRASKEGEGMALQEQGRGAP
jgi:hypothetical protein